MEKLEAYRLRKRRKETFENFKTKLVKMIPFYNERKDDDVRDSPAQIQVEPSSSKTRASSTEQSSTLTISVSPGCSESEVEFVSDDDENISSKKTSTKLDDSNPIVPVEPSKRILLWAVIFIFWITCFAIAIELQFGIIFFMLTILYGIYYNTRTGPKKRGEISAYSVFNKDCHAIDGTLNAEQFEREIRYGSASVR